jgi:hypothetical protein
MGVLECPSHGSTANEHHQPPALLPAGRSTNPLPKSSPIFKNKMGEEDHTFP